MPTRRTASLLIITQPEQSRGGTGSRDALATVASVAIDTCAYSSVIPDAIGNLATTCSIAIEICDELIAPRLELCRRLGRKAPSSRGYAARAERYRGDGPSPS
jgi:hypothetical protein